jgi:hypothetical protein
MPKDTESKKRVEQRQQMQEYEVTVHYKTRIVGRDETDALTSYKDWLDRFTFDYSIAGIKHIGKAW